MENILPQDKMRIVQELVPGRQITLAHIIANPDPILYPDLAYNAEADTMTISMNYVTFMVTVELAR